MKLGDKDKSIDNGKSAEGSCDSLRANTISRCMELLASLEGRDFEDDAELDAVLAESDAIRERIALLEQADNDVLLELIYGEKLNLLYTFVNEEDLAYVKSLQPRSLVFNGSFSLEQRKWIYAIFLLRKEDVNIQDLMSKLQDLFGCEKYQTVASVTAWLSPNLIKKLSPDKLELYNEVMAYLERKKNPGPDKDVSGTEEKLDGAHFEYDNPTKEAWRRAKMDYLDRQIPAEGRDKLRVVCLGGRRCLDIPHYLRMGFSPENIISVEGDKSIWEEHEETARGYGIVPMRGDLAALISKGQLPGQFDVIDFDFVGPLSVSNLAILHEVSTSDRCVSFVNVLAAREHKATNSLMRAETALFRGNKLSVDKLTTSNPSAEDVDMLIGSMNDEQLRDIRIGSLVRHIALLLGMFCRNNFMFRDRVNQFLEKICLGVSTTTAINAFSKIAMEVIEQYVEMEFEIKNKMAGARGRNIPYNREDVHMETLKRMRAFTSILFGESTTADVRAIKYLSPPHQTSFTTVAITKVRQPLEERENHVEFADFILKLMEEYTRDKNIKIVFSITERDGSTITDGALRVRKYKPYNDKELNLTFCRVEGTQVGKFNTKIRLDRVKSAVENFFSLQSQDVINSAIRGSSNFEVQDLS